MANQKQSAFLKAYQSCHEPFIRYCSALAFGKMDTEDLVQDVLLSAYTHFEQIREKDNFLHYLIRAARNRSISLWRKKRFQAELIEKHAARLIAKGTNPEVLVDIQLLYKTLDRLPEKQAEALILFEISGFSMKEVAQIQGSTTGAVKTKISRGRNRLRSLLRENHSSSSITQLFETAKMILL